MRPIPAARGRRTGGRKRSQTEVVEAGAESSCSFPEKRRLPYEAAGVVLAMKYLREYILLNETAWQ